MDRSALFVSAQPAERELILMDGTVTPVFVREVADADWMRYMAHIQSDNADVQGGARAFLISKGWVDIEGKPVATHEEACALRTPIARQLVKLIIALQPEPERKGNA